MVPGAGIQDRLGDFLHEGYKLWEWRVDRAANRLYHIYGEKMDVYTPISTLQRGWQLLEEEAPALIAGAPCSTRDRPDGRVNIVSTASEPLTPDIPTTFREVLEEWGHGWMWRSLWLTGDDGWLEEAIEHGTLVAVTDGSYIKEMHPELCSAAYILECSEGRGRMVGSFPELSVDACAYRGEMLGLLAIHLILLAVNRISSELGGKVIVYSDCLGALTRVASVEGTRLPSGTKHADILKIIMVHCRQYSFDVEYNHVKAHQDDTVKYNSLLRPAQLNCQADYLAKRVIWGLEGRRPPPQSTRNTSIGGGCGLCWQAEGHLRCR